MSPNGNSLLERALDLVSGRTSSGEPATDAYLAYAEALRAARRGVLDAPGCPTAVLRRAQALFGERGGVRILRLVFDSWRDAAPATRGAGRARSLRYEDGDHALDLRVTRPPSGDVLLQVAVEPPEPGLTAHLDVRGSKRKPRIALDESGAGQIRIPRDAHALSVRVGTDERIFMEAPDVALE